MQELKTLLEVETEAFKIVKDALSKKESSKDEAIALAKEYELERLKEAEQKIEELDNKTLKELEKLTETYDKELKNLKKSLNKDIDEKVSKAVSKLLEVVAL